MVAERSVIALDERRAVQIPAEILEQVLVSGDLKGLTPEQRVVYYRGTCASLGLNYLTKPFEYIELNGRMQLYALKNCTDQMRGQRHIDVKILAREKIDDLYVVTARATEALGTPAERSDESVGAVSIAGKKGDDLANAFMRAETKAKRRATLSLCGLGMLDETEIESVPDAGRVTVDHATGEIIDAEPARAAQSRPQPAPAATKTTHRQAANAATEKHPIDAYWVQWNQLVAEARSHGLNPPGLAANASKADISAAGTHWRARIAYKVACDKAEALGIPFKALADSASAVELMAGTRELAPKIAEAESIAEAEAPMASGLDEDGADKAPDF